MVLHYEVFTVAERTTNFTRILVQGTDVAVLSLEHSLSCHHKPTAFNFNTVAVPGFPIRKVEGGANLVVVVPTYYFGQFSPKMHDNENFDRESLPAPRPPSGNS